MNPDPASPIPIYHQIASDLRERIERGELTGGSTLEPVRDAARRLGVNVHTVRHAYAELAREGLVEPRRKLGTRVVPIDERTRAPEPRAFLADVVKRARDEFGLAPRELVRELRTFVRETRAERPRVHVLECSVEQASDLADQLEARWALDARPWPLDRPGELPSGALVATFFHYNEIRTRWPDRLARVRFATIRPDAQLARRLGGTGSGRRTVTLCELDEPTLAAVAADLSQVLPASRFTIRTRVVTRPSEALDGAGRTPVILPPRVWGRLTLAERDDPRAVHMRYVFDTAELEQLGPVLGARANDDAVTPAR